MYAVEIAVERVPAIKIEYIIEDITWAKGFRIGIMMTKKIVICVSPIMSANFNSQGFG